MMEFLPNDIAAGFDEAHRRRGITGDILVQLLETRLDNVCYRLGLGATRRASRQLVGHGHVKVNGRRVDIPSYCVKAGDVIAEVKDDKIDFQIKAVDAQLLGLNASLRDAEVELDRADRLVRSGATSTQRLDQLNARVDGVEQQMREAKTKRARN